jgi:hypothetical protein
VRKQKSNKKKTARCNPKNNRTLLKVLIVGMGITTLTYAGFAGSELITKTTNEN